MYIYEYSTFFKLNNLIKLMSFSHPNFPFYHGQTQAIINYDSDI